MIVTRDTEEQEQTQCVEKVDNNALLSLSPQLHSIRSTRRRSLGSAALWVETSSVRSELSLPAPKPSTADAASTRRSNADYPGRKRPTRL